LEAKLLGHVVLREVHTDIGSRVRFPTDSVFLPNQEEALGFASGNDEIEGIITGFSDSGVQLRAYAVVEVVRKLSLVVPVHDLRLVSESGPNAVQFSS
jgi:hypothetical protein